MSLRHKGVSRAVRDPHAANLFYQDGYDAGSVHIDLDRDDLDLPVETVVKRERALTVRSMRESPTWESIRTGYAKTKAEARRLFQAFLDGQDDGIRSQLSRMRLHRDDPENWDNTY